MSSLLADVQEEEMGYRERVIEYVDSVFTEVSLMPTVPSMHTRRHRAKKRGSKDAMLTNGTRPQSGGGRDSGGWW